MLYPIKKSMEDFKNIKKANSLDIQMKAVRLQDKLGELKFHEDLKKVFEPVTKSLENLS